ncbi:DUF429 domain-containing protein [Blastococcus sp. SYSU D00813]
MPVLGVDGWRGRWAGALLEGRSVRLLVLDDAAAVLAVPGVEVVGIDMPIGLSDDGVRACDVAARAALRGRGATGSVFPAPVRAVLAAGDYAQARLRSVEATGGRSLSAQSFQLVASIRSLDDALGEPPDPRVHEVFPELAFRALDERVLDPKSTARGLAQRVRALQPVMDVLDALADAPPALPAVDALDACAAAWSARRIADGTACRVGQDVRDARGRPMRISW